MGGVSWNIVTTIRDTRSTIVATLMGGVSWNPKKIHQARLEAGRHPYGWRELKCFGTLKNEDLQKVAALMGGVSWNHLMVGEAECLSESPPLWVAWVEIEIISTLPADLAVATLMGGVSWNLLSAPLFSLEYRRHPHGWCELKFISTSNKSINTRSPPTWVVWVEIKQGKRPLCQ